MGNTRCCFIIILQKVHIYHRHLYYNLFTMKGLKQLYVETKDMSTAHFRKRIPVGSFTNMWSSSMLSSRSRLTCRCLQGWESVYGNCPWWLGSCRQGCFPEPNFSTPVCWNLKSETASKEPKLNTSVTSDQNLWCDHGENIKVVSWRIQVEWIKTCTLLSSPIFSSTCF